MEKHKTILSRQKITRYCCVVFMLLASLSCSEDDMSPIYEAEGYIIGYHPCVRHATVTTSQGQGKGYLVATTDATPDTLMVYGVPVGMFDIPDEYFFGAIFLPEETHNMFKIRFSYQVSFDNIGLQRACSGTVLLDNYFQYATPEYTIIKVERIEEE